MKICNISLFAALRNDDINAEYEIKTTKNGEIQVIFKGEIAKSLIKRASKN